MMKQSSDRHSRRRATLIALPASIGARNRPRSRGSATVRRAPGAPSASPPLHAPVRFAPAPRWRPPLRLVSSNATPRPPASRARPQLRLLPAPVATWSSSAPGMTESELPGPSRPSHAIVVILLAAAGLAALATSIGRLFAG